MRRLQRYFPIFLIALMVQIMAPIGASWAFASAVSDPLAAAEICHQSDPSSNGNDQGSQHQSHDAGCTLCCGFNANIASSHAPDPASFVRPHRAARIIVWRHDAPRLAEARTGSNAKARAPPSIS
jgi:hypothetical protein